MDNKETLISRGAHLRKRVSWVCGALALLALLLAAPASATVEQVATFADEPGTPPNEGNRQLFRVEALAVNTTGAGGVPVGTLYEISYRRARVIRYSPTGEFREAWGWGVGNGGNELQSCGPDGDPLFSTCQTMSTSQETEIVGVPGDGLGQLSSEPKGIAVDQSTGNVYVLNQRGDNQDAVVQVFNADGTEVISGFGEEAVADKEPKVGEHLPGESIAENPEEIHVPVSAGLAVDDAGNVYIGDRDFSRITTSSREARVMVFHPETAGDYSHYVYAGRANDIAKTNLETSSGQQPEKLAVDSAGDLYSGNGSQIVMFAPGERDAPTCDYAVPGGGAEAFAVDENSGEAFYWSSKNLKYHQLSGCRSSGEYKEIAVFSKTTQEPTGPAGALAYNPNLSFASPRPPGILYAGYPAVRGGVIFASAEVHDPSVESESVSTVTATTAVLGSAIDPHGTPTRYVLQYLTESEYQANDPGQRFAGAHEAPPGGAPLGSGESILSGATTLSGLQPDTTYRFRVRALSGCEPEHPENVCEAVGGDGSFHTYPAEAQTLPDGRAYELISPVDKSGGQVFPAEPLASSCGECKPGIGASSYAVQAAPDGEALVYEGTQFAANEGAADFNEYLSRRSSTGWSTTNLSPARLSESALYTAFDTALTEGLILQPTLALAASAPEGYDNLYAQPTEAPSTLRPALTSAPPNRAPGQFEVGYAGASADLSRVFFEANDMLTEATPFAPEALLGSVVEENLYESAEGGLRLVNVLPGNQGTAPGATFGAVVGTTQENSGHLDLSHAISSDGRRIFWSSSAGQTFVRENGETTKEVPDPSKFLTASADGSRVLLADGKLFNVDDLGEAPVDLTDGEGGFQGIVGQSEDLGEIYFVDTAALAPGTEARTCVTSNKKPEREDEEEGIIPTGRGCNLYAYHDGLTTFIAALLAEDNIGAAASRDQGYGGDWLPSPAHRTAEASPNGRWVAFESTAPLTGFDTAGDCEKTACFEDFLFDSATNTLRCVSCSPSGSRPLGSSSLRLLNGARDNLPQSRYLTDTGRLYFDSQDSLSPFDTNHGVEDVYQFEPDEIGNCARAAGCVQLISAGHGTVDSNFLAMDPSGKNVFFTTRDQLVRSDRDELLDVYDAREGGGIAAEGETGGGECQGESCQPTIAPPNGSAPASSSFEGAGNLVPPLVKPAGVATAKTVVSVKAKLAKALRTCHRDKSKAKRALCEKRARQRYRSKPNPKPNAKPRKRRK
jgi:hypothetical protein